MKIKEKLGVFDSGVGGFSVLREVLASTSVDVIYFGDCARAPYGNKSREVIISYMKEIITSLKSKGVTHFVSACNSMSVVTTNALLKECDVNASHYIDMTRACSAYSVFSGDEIILITGTVATIQSGTYQSLLRESNVLFYEYQFPSLAGAIENGVTRDVLIEIIKPALQYAKMANVTHILYGCTHYPLVHDVFLEVANDIGWKGGFIDPARYVARAVEGWKLQGDNQVAYEASKETEVFKEIVTTMDTYRNLYA